jgi:hypothetical protein
MALVSNVLETCKLNSPEANYKVSTIQEEGKTTKRIQTTYKNRAIYIVIIIQFFIIYVRSQQLQGQLQIQHSVDTSNFIKDEHNMRATATYNSIIIIIIIIIIPLT